MWEIILRSLVTFALCLGFFFVIGFLAVIAWWKEEPSPKRSSGKIGE